MKKQNSAECDRYIAREIMANALYQTARFNNFDFTQTKNYSDLVVLLEQINANDAYWRDLTNKDTRNFYRKKASFLLWLLGGRGLKFKPDLPQANKALEHLMTEPSKKLYDAKSENLQLFPPVNSEGAQTQ